MYGQLVRKLPGARRWRLFVVLALLLLAFSKMLIVTAWIHAAFALGFASSVTAAVADGLSRSGKWYMWWPFPVFLGPVVEEIIFRVGLTGALLRRLPEVAAVILSAAVFGAIHGVIGFAGSFASGLLLGLVYARTRSVGLCVLYHVAGNSLPWVFVAWGSPADPLIQVREAASPAWIFARLMALALGLWMLGNSLRRIPIDQVPVWRRA